MYNGASIIPSKMHTPDPCPHMDLYWVFRSQFIPWFLALLVAVKAAVGFHLNTCFICPYDILKGTTEVSLAHSRRFA